MGDQLLMASEAVLDEHIEEHSSSSGGESVEEEEGPAVTTDRKGRSTYFKTGLAINISPR